MPPRRSCFAFEIVTAICNLAGFNATTAFLLRGVLPVSHLRIASFNATTAFLLPSTSAQYVDISLRFNATTAFLLLSWC